MDYKIPKGQGEEKLKGDSFINWGIFLIILGPIIGVLSVFITSGFVGKFISTDGGVEALIILGGVSAVGTGMSLVIIGCTRNLIQKFEK